MSSPVTAPSPPSPNSSQSKESSDSPPSPSSSDNSPPSPSDNNNNNNSSNNNSDTGNGNNNNNSSSNNNNNNNNSNNSPPPPSPSDDSSPPPPSPNNSSPPSPQSNNNGSSSPPPPPKENSSSPPSPSGGSSPPSPSGGSSPPKSSSKSPPPPHSSSQNSPSPPTPNSKSNSNSNSGSSPSLPKGEAPKSGEQDFGHWPLVIGVTAGVAALLIIMIVIFCSKKKKRRNEPMHYYMDQGPKGANVQYYNSTQHQGWQNGPMDHVIKVPQSAASSGPPGTGWLQPPPPPPMMSSSEVSSNFSGPRQPVLPPPSPNLAFGFNQSTFTYEELAAATNGFSQANLLGQGGFGYVHKGVLANGKVVAVKSLKSGSGQGEREFQAEVEIISRVHHRHLVSLVGYCIAGGQRMLIYEFVPNNTLEYHLHGSGRPTMEWSTRMTIALGSAKGLAYLHEDCHPRIIHRDIKTANILLDDNWEAMVADFGLAKLSDANVTHVSTRVMGTFGYLAPEYASSGKLTEKSDVFSYGVMLLELITGRRPVDTTNQYMEDSLVDWARPILTRAQGDGDYDEIVDPRLENNYIPTELARMVACASASVRHSAKRRPRMSQIVRVLEGAVSLDDLNEGTRPGQSRQYSSNGSSDYDTATYNADMKKFRNMALNSQEYTSSEYGAHTTSDSGRMPSSSGASEGQTREK